MTPHEFARELVKFALNTKDVAASCAPPSATPKVALQVHDGWSFGLDVYEHPMSGLIKLSVETFIFHYRLSAKLYPLGRGSTEKDWDVLGAVVGNIVMATGNKNPVEPLVPIDEVHPNASMHWMWHSDGSAVDQRVYDGTASVIKRIQSVQRQQAAAAHAEQQRLAALPEGKHERNEPCPCGSGKKFKKCHGGAS